MKRFDLRWCRLDPVEGSEIGKTRPVVIVSLDALNQRLRTVTVCPLTSQLHPGWRARVVIGTAGRPVEIAVDQIRTIAKSRLGDLIGFLTANEAESLRRVLTEMYGES
jgi:mRNA interferase MazF